MKKLDPNAERRPDGLFVSKEPPPECVYAVAKPMPAFRRELPQRNYAQLKEELLAKAPDEPLAAEPKPQPELIELEPAPEPEKEKEEESREAAQGRWPEAPKPPRRRKCNRTLDLSSWLAGPRCPIHQRYFAVARSHDGPYWRTERISQRSRP